MRLFIAEKPSLGRVIAGSIGIMKEHREYIECRDDTVVTWCFGHILELQKPDYYLKDKRWRIEDLPIIPSQWKKTVKSDARAQFRVIKELAMRADEIINAGDPDREGQLLVDEVVEYLGIRKPVKRIWLQALDDVNVRKALANMKDNRKYIKYKQSAEARSYADWLVGMNLTRYFSLKAGSLITVGRVQTPTLALVVRRDESIESFTPHDYYIINADLENGVKAAYRPPEDMDGLDEDGRLIDKRVAVSIVSATTGKKATVVEFSRRFKKEYPPMPFMLSSLQKYASSKYGATAQQTLTAAQSLYEKKLITYPRTDCRYIPEEQHADASKILNNLKKIFSGDERDVIARADPEIKHRAFDSEKLTAHSAIIPTGDTGAVPSLKGLEKSLYLDIIKSYACLFHKPIEYYSVYVEFDIAGYRFTSTARQIISPGFKQYCGDGTSSTSLPDLKKGQALINRKSSLEIKQTTPPPRFTDGTLIDAMSHIYKYIEDKEAKSILKENDGIGTEATRARIIEQLVRRGYLVRKGKQIYSTQTAREFIKQLPDFIKDPVLTAEWERALSGILEGKVSFDSFMKRQKEFVRKHISKQYPIVVRSKNAAVESGKRSKKGVCPNCGNNMAKLKTKTGKSYYWCGNCKTAYWVNKGGRVGKKWDFSRSQIGGGG